MSRAARLEAGAVYGPRPASPGVAEGNRPRRGRAARRSPSPRGRAGRESPAAVRPHARLPSDPLGALFPERPLSFARNIFPGIGPLEQEAVMRSDLIPRPSPLRPRPQPSANGLNPGGGVATAVEPLLVHFFGGPPPVRFEFWDGTFLGPAGGTPLRSARPMPSNACCGRPASSGWPGHSSWAISRSKAISSPFWPRCTPRPRRASTSGPRCPGRRCRRRAVSGSSADRSHPHPRRPHPGDDCTRAVATHRQSSTTTTSATTSTPWSSVRP